MNTYHAPAKLNLSLKVLRRRQDGFHEVETLMVPLALHDEMEFLPADQFSMVCDYPGVPLDESNLVAQALRLLERKTGKEFRYKITMRKNIPHGAGLAGGSSNAATTLMAVNELENLGFSQAELAEMGATFGSDVSFFIYQQASLCRGRGEVVEPLEFDHHEQVLLVKPSFGVSTPAAYKAWQGAQKIVGIDYGPVSMPWGKMENDLELPVFQKHRFLSELKMWLLGRQEVKTAMMSGSGSTVFAILKKEATAELERDLRKQVDPHLQIFRTRF